MLENHYKSTVAKSLRIFPVRDSAVVKQLDTIGICEMRAMVREHVVTIAQFMRWHWAYCGFVRDSHSSSLRGGYEDQKHLSHACEERTERGLWIIPRLAHLLPGPTKIIQENHDIIG